MVGHEKGKKINGMKNFISKVLRATCLPSSMHLLVSFFKGFFCQRNRQKGRMLGLRLSISLSQRFYKKIGTLEIEVDEDFIN